MTTGCAFVSPEIRPSEQPLPTVEQVGKGRDVIIDLTFEDVRADKPCGVQKNGWSMDTATVDCVEPPGKWMSGALARGLANAGFHVLAPNAQPGPDTVVVHGKVDLFFAEPKDDFTKRTVEMLIGMKLTVTSASGLVAERRFYTRGFRTGMASTDGTFQDAANDAQREIIDNAVTAIAQLLDRYPSLGERRGES